MKKPKPPTHYWQGQFFRVGAHDFVYRWNGSDWIKSTVTRTELKGYHECNSFNFSEGL